MSTLLSLRHLSKLVKYPATTTRIWCGNKQKSFSVASIREMTTTSEAKNVKSETVATSPASSEDEWRSIYRLPLIRLASAFNRVKIPYGLANMFLLPAMYGLEHAAHVPGDTAGIIAAVGITSWLTLAVCSLAVTNLVGIVYVNDTNDRIKLAYVDYWGKRHDVSFELDDLVYDGEHKKKPNIMEFYTTLSFYSNEKLKYKLLQRYGDIEDPETFVGIFGE